MTKPETKKAEKAAAKTDKQKLAAEKRKLAAKEKAAKEKAQAKEKAAKEKAEEKRVAERAALAAIKVPAKEITAAKAALKRINAAPQTVRADYLKIGKMFVDGKAYCLNEEGKVNNVVFGQWLDKISFGNDVIDKSKRSNIIWMTEKQEAIAKNSEEVLEQMGDEISPNRYRSFFRNLTVEQCPDELYTEMGFDAEARSQVTQINEPEEAEGGAEKEEKEFDHNGFTSRTVATLMDKFEAGTPEFEHFVAELRAALEMMSNIETTEEEPVAQAGQSTVVYEQHRKGRFIAAFFLEKQNE